MSDFEARAHGVTKIPRLESTVAVVDVKLEMDDIADHPVRQLVVFHI